MASSFTEAELAKLPRWAREKVADLELKANAAITERDDERAIATGQNPPTAIKVAYRTLTGYRDLYLGERETIEITVRPRARIRVSLRDGRVDVNGDGPLSIHPRSSNAFDVEVEGR
jgi:hypothetical protein